jgi:NADH-quinone oxidoreductase subunit N
MQLNHLLAELMPQHLAQALGSAAALLGHLLGYQTLALLGAAAGWWLVSRPGLAPELRPLTAVAAYLLLSNLSGSLYGSHCRNEWGLAADLVNTPHWGGETLLLTPTLLAAQLLLLLLYGLFRFSIRGCSTAAERRYYDLLLLLYLLLASVQDFLLLYLLVETANMALYRLLSLQQPRPRLEPLLSYFLLNLLGSLLLLLAFGFLYRASGGLSFGEVALGALAASGASDALAGELLLGMATLLVGLLLKLGLAPFHHWVAPIYQALPLPLFGFLMLFPKASLLLLLTQLVGGFGFLAGGQLANLLLLLGALNLVWGTLGALHQTNLKRLLIHSSLANLGVYFYALAVGGVGPSGSAAFYLLLYLATTAALLLPLLAVAQRPYGGWSLPELGRSCDPQLSLQLSLAALNLSGLPPFALFFGKLPVALELLEAGCYGSLGLLLVFSVVAVAYTLALLLLLWYQQQPTGHPAKPRFLRTLGGLGLAPLLQLLLAAQLAQDSALALLPLQGGANHWEMAPAWSFGPGLLELQLQLQQLLLPLLLIWSLLYLLQWWVSGFRGTDGGLRDQLRAWAHPEVSGDPADNRVIGVAFRGAGLPLLAVALADPESPEGSENIPATPAEPTPAEPTAAPADAEVVAFSSDEELNEFMWQNMRNQLKKTNSQEPTAAEEAF